MSTAPSDYPAQFSVDYPDRDLNRVTTAFRLFTVMCSRVDPHWTLSPLTS
jgi:hypothetical protein